MPRILSMGVFPAIVVSLLLVTGLATECRAQGAGMTGITTATTREMNDTMDMGRQTPQKFEQEDDPTIAQHPIPQHQPTRAARKAAEKGEHFAKKKMHEEAIAQYKEALTLDPLYYDAGIDLAMEYEAMGNRAEAENTYRNLMKSAPEHVLAFTNLAALLSQEHHYAEAEAVMRQAMKQHSYSFKANLTLGTVLVDEGKLTAEAKNTLEYAKVRYPQAKAMLQKWPAQ